MTDQAIGTARIDLTGDASGIEVAAARAKKAIRDFSSDAQAAYQQADAAGKRASTSLAKWVQQQEALNAPIDRNAASLKLFNAAASNVPIKILEEARQRIDALASAQEAAAVSAQRMSDASAFEKQAQAAQRLVQASEYVNWWKDALQQADAQEQASKDAALFQEKHQAAQRLVQSTEYVRWWEDALEKADIAEKRLASDKAFIKSLQDRANAAGKTAAELLEMQAAERGLSSQAAPFIARLKEQEGALKSSGITFNEYGLSAKQTTAALRQVPAQITDIVVSLQGGQKPLTVLLQQGGQLKDLFGGVVPAARALSSQLLKMITPATLLAGAGVALGAAWYKGAMEMSEVEKRLVMTGNAMGITAGQVSFLADKFNEIDGVTRGAAVSALTEITKTGKVTSSQLGMIGEVAVRANQILGKEISATVDEFNRLAEEPATASAELTKQYNYLNAETYLRIKALEDQGRKEEAAALAQDTFAKATNERLSEVKGNLTLLERGWDAVTGAAGRAWDRMADSGRPTTILGQIKKQQEELEKLYQRRDQDKEQREVAGIGDYVEPNLARRIAEEEKNLRNLQEQLRRESGRQVLAANREYETQLAAQREAYIDDNASKAELRKKAVDEETRKWKKLSAGLEEGSKEYERLYAAHQNSLKSIEDKYKPKGGTRKAYSNDYATRMLLDLNQKEAAFRAQATGIDKLTSAQREMARFEQEIADIKEKKILTADEKSLVLKEEEIRLQLKANVAAEKEAQARESVLKFQERSRQIAEQMSAARESQNDQYQRSLDAYGLGDKAMERVQAQRSIFKEFASYQRQLSRGADLGLIGSKEYQEESSKIQAELQRRLLMDRSYYEEVDRLQSSWSLGAHQGLANYADYAANVFSGMEGLVGNAFGGMADALSTFVRTGKTSFSDLANSIIEDMIRITVQQSITGPLASALGGALGSAFGSMSSNWSSTNTSNPWSLSSLGVTPSANGNVFESADLSRFSNGVYDSPKMFAFAKGAGIFAEAGPEAIMPLSRGADGRLGVRAEMPVMPRLSGSGQPQVNVSIHGVQSQPEVSARRNESGGFDIDIMFKQVEKRLASNVASGQGSMSKALERRYALTPQLG